MSQQYNEIAKTCACFNFRRASRSITALFNHALSPAQLTSSQFVALLVLALNSEMRMSDMAELLGVDRTTLTRRLAPLQRRRLLKLTPSMKDKRSRKATLTAVGKKHLDSAIPYWKKAQSEVIHLFGNSHWEVMLGKLEQASTITDHI